MVAAFANLDVGVMRRCALDALPDEGVFVVRREKPCNRTELLGPNNQINFRKLLA